MREQILAIIEKNSRINIKELAVILGADELTIANELKAMEEEGVICGYHTMIDSMDISRYTVQIFITEFMVQGRRRSFSFMGMGKIGRVSGNR